MLNDSLKDIIKHTHGLGFIEMVKLLGSTTETRIEAIDNDKTVVLYGKMHNPIKDLDTTIGLTRLNVLKGCLEYFSGDDATATVVKECKNGADIPVELLFETKSGKSNYRFMADAAVSENIKVPPFKGVVWNVVVNPTKEALKSLSFFASVHGSFESTFFVAIDKSTLLFKIGSGTNDRTTLKFAEGVKGTMSQWEYPLSQVLSILKLSETSDCTMSFSDMGALKINIDSGLGSYEYIVPARQ